MQLDHRTALAKIYKDSDKDMHARGHVPVLEGNLQICLIYRTAAPPDISLREFRKKGSDCICQIHQVWKMNARSFPGKDNILSGM